MKKRLQSLKSIYKFVIMIVSSFTTIYVVNVIFSKKDIEFIWLVTTFIIAYYSYLLYGFGDKKSNDTDGNDTEH